MKVLWKRMLAIGSAVLLLFLVVYLAYAAFSGTKRRLGPESIFDNATVKGGITLGSLSAEGSIKLTPVASAPTCDGNNEGKLYVNSSDHVVYLCNGTSWSSI